MDQIEQAVMYALGPQVDHNLKAQVIDLKDGIFIRVSYSFARLMLIVNK